jgi:hypothetical protein
MSLAKQYADAAYENHMKFLPAIKEAIQGRKLETTERYSISLIFDQINAKSTELDAWLQQLHSFMEKLKK